MEGARHPFHYLSVSLALTAKQKSDGVQNKNQEFRLSQRSRKKGRRRLASSDSFLDIPLATNVAVAQIKELQLRGF